MDNESIETLSALVDDYYAKLQSATDPEAKERVRVLLQELHWDLTLEQLGAAADWDADACGEL